MAKFDRIRMMLVMVSALGLAVACGDDDDDDDDSAMVDAGRDSGGPTGPEEATCGDTTCEGTTVLGSTNLNACCPAGDPANDCGLDTTGALLQTAGIRAGCLLAGTAAGSADDSCPSTTPFQITTVGTLPGCCQADNTCGFLINLDTPTLQGPNFGCRPWQTLTDSALTMVEGITDPSTPQSCGGEAR